MEVDRAHVSGYVVPLFRPAAVADVLDVIVTDERIVEVLQHIGIDRPNVVRGRSFVPSANGRPSCKANLAGGDKLLGRAAMTTTVS